MMAYYNENDPFAAVWLRELIKVGVIAPGYVDERSILEVKADDLKGYTQCHFFAGIGVWSYALRQAGWPDDRPVWTGSCPCQPFSDAGDKEGFADARHLWPIWDRLISESAPDVVFGEQVASKDGLAWLDLVYAGLEGKNYAVGSIDTCAAGFGAPHIRQRLYFVAVADTDIAISGDGELQYGRQLGLAKENESAGGGVGVAESKGLERFARTTNGVGESGRIPENPAGPITSPSPQPVNGFWSEAEWLPCSDGRWRPIEPGSSPLVNGAPARLGRLRGYGNAINAEQAKAFVEAYLETEAIDGAQ